MKKNAIDPLQWDKHRREVIHEISKFMVANLIELYEQFQGDMLEIIVLGEIANQNMVGYFKAKQANPSLTNGEKLRIEGVLLNKTTALTVSDATGIPRETVRRKVNKLIEKNWVKVDESKRLYINSEIGPGFEESNRRNAEILISLGRKIENILSA